MAATISEIAKRLNISHSTVSRVLNDRGKQYASEETARQIRELAIELNYRPNRLANGLLRGKTHVLGVVMGRCNDNYVGSVLEGIRVAAAAAGHQILLGHAYNHEGAEASQVRLLLDYRVDGLICFADRWERQEIEGWLDEVRQMRLPCVIVDSHLFKDRVDCVSSDDIAGARMAVRHLIELGHRRIGHIGAGDRRATSTERRLGYMLAHADAGIEPDPRLVLGTKYSEEEAVTVTEEMIAMQDRPTAIFVVSDPAAVCAYQVLQDHGLRVPEDMSLVGYSNHDRGVSLRLTSVDQHPLEIGRRAVEQLFAREQDPDGPPVSIDVETSLVVRRTTAAPHVK